MTRLEKTAATSLVLSFLLLAGVLTRGYILSRRPDAAAVPLVKVGEVVRLPEFSRGNAESTLVMVLSSGCHYCMEGLPFYKQLSAVRKSSGNSIQLVAVLPEQKAAAQTFLEGAGIATDGILSMAPSELGVRILPTLLLLDREGKLQRYWAGELNKDAQEEVLKALRSKIGSYAPDSRSSHWTEVQGQRVLDASIGDSELKTIDKNPGRTP